MPVSISSLLLITPSLNKQCSHKKEWETKSVRICMDVNEATPEMRHNISLRIWNNAQDETNVGEKEEQTDEVSNRERERQRQRERERAQAKGNT